MMENEMVMEVFEALLNEKDYVSMKNIRRVLSACEKLGYKKVEPGFKVINESDYEKFMGKREDYKKVLQLNSEYIERLVANQEMTTSAGKITTSFYNDEIAKGIQVYLDDTIVAMLDVYEPVEGETEGEARVLVYRQDPDFDEPTHCIPINR